MKSSMIFIPISVHQAKLIVQDFETEKKLFILKLNNKTWHIGPRDT